DRFPFRYLAEDYGLTCYAAFSGCSAETEASFETIAFLSEKVKELSLAHVITIEGSETKIADTVLAGAGAAGSDILVLDSMQSTTAQDAEGGVSYLSVMEKNLEVLKEALQ
ncbi:MAG: zinc ABC transporter substrate-binding protein, partial [Lachnospiraceae bacterium]|nr:zinc ABC transporter substrate-binding protein [Lachnospiraceae bacterium]